VVIKIAARIFITGPLLLFQEGSIIYPPTICCGIFFIHGMVLQEEASLSNEARSLPAGINPGYLYAD
jgi:hypothetical protein